MGADSLIEKLEAYKQQHNHGDMPMDPANFYVNGCVAIIHQHFADPVLSYMDKTDALDSAIRLYHPELRAKRTNAGSILDAYEKAIRAMGSEQIMGDAGRKNGTFPARQCAVHSVKHQDGSVSPLGCELDCPGRHWGDDQREIMGDASTRKDEDTLQSGMTSPAKHGLSETVTVDPAYLASLQAGQRGEICDNKERIKIVAEVITEHLKEHFPNLLLPGQLGVAQKIVNDPRFSPSATERSSESPVNILQAIIANDVVLRNLLACDSLWDDDPDIRAVLATNSRIIREGATKPVFGTLDEFVDEFENGCGIREGVERVLKAAGVAYDE